MAFQESLTRVRQSNGRQLIGASFRGVPFLVASSERSGGRRSLSHEYPLRNENTVEDLGRSRRTFRIDGYVLGDDYVAQRDALLDALENRDGPGELIHPYYGSFQALCSSISVSESTSDGGRANFSLEFFEVQGAPITPEQQTDRVADTSDKAQAAQSQSETEFTEQYDTSRSPSFAVASLTAELQTRTEGLREALGRVVADTQELARLELEVDTLVAEINSIIRDPADVIASYATVLASVTETILDAPGDVLGALLEVYELADQTLAIGDTDVRSQERTNQIALTNYLKRVLVIEAGRLSPLVPYTTLEQATSTRQAIIDRLDEQSAQATDETFGELQLLRSSVSSAVPGEQELARLITLNIRASVPSLLLSYRLYQTVEREQDILDRNVINDPSFIFGDVEVLSQ